MMCLTNWNLSLTRYKSILRFTVLQQSLFFFIVGFVIKVSKFGLGFWISFLRFLFGVFARQHQLFKIHMLSNTHICVLAFAQYLEAKTNH